MLNLPIDESHSPKPQILICDDDVDFASELIEALEARGFSAIHLLTITAIRASLLVPSIILLDLCMPQRSAIDIAKFLGEHPRKDYFKIILITGCSKEIIQRVSVQFESRDLQLIGAFQKPIDVKKLGDLLNTTIEGVAMVSQRLRTSVE